MAKQSPSSAADVYTVTVWETGQIKRVFRRAVPAISKDNDMLTIIQDDGAKQTHYPIDSIIRYQTVKEKVGDKPRLSVVADS